MSLLGRNNFGNLITHFPIPKFKTERQVKKLLKKICGRKYPIKAADLIGRLRGRDNSLMLLLNKRGIEIVSDLNDGYCNYDSLEQDYWQSQRRIEQGVSLQKQAWQFMADHYKLDWKMKEPQK